MTHGETQQREMLAQRRIDKSRTAVVERDRLRTASQRLDQPRDADALVVEFDVAVNLEPVDTARDLHLQRLRAAEAAAVTVDEPFLFQESRDDAQKARRRNGPVVP